MPDDAFGMFPKPGVAGSIPAGGSIAKGKARAKTDERYCIYDEAHDDYIYTPAFTELLVGNCATAEGFVKVIGRQPRMQESKSA